MGVNGSGTANQRRGVAGGIVGEIILGPFTTGVAFCLPATLEPFASREAGSFKAVCFNLVFGWLTIVEKPF